MHADIPAHGPDDVPSADDRPASQFAVLADEFIKRFNGLAEIGPLAAVITQAAFRGVRSDHSKFLNDYCNPVEGEPHTFRIPFNVYRRHTQYLERIKQTEFAVNAIPKSFVVTLVSEFDAFISGLMRVLFGLKPHLLAASDKPLKYSDLLDFGTIEAARDYVIERETESLLRDSHTEQFAWLERKLEITLTKDLAVWPEFIELTERRNLFVHTGGAVTKQYLDVVAKVGIDRTGITRGSTLSVNKAYLERAHEIVFELSTKLVHVLWRKLLPTERAEADRHLNENVIYELLRQERFALAATMAEFGTGTLKKWSSDETRRMMIINQAQAYKWQGRQQDCLKAVAGEDWSSVRDDFQLCLHVLRDEFDKLLKLMVSQGRADSPSLHGYREWPIFRDTREKKEFQDTIETVFGETLALNARRPTTIEEAVPTDANTIDGVTGKNDDVQAGTESIQERKVRRARPARRTARRKKPITKSKGRS